MNTDLLVTELKILTDTWFADAEGRRKKADAATDKVWSAGQYGIADTYEDVASTIQRALQRLANNLGETVNWARLTEQWESLAVQERALAEADDNRLTIAYRKAGSETYQNAVKGVRAVLEMANAD